jgi:hypothetical protein
MLWNYNASGQIVWPFTTSPRIDWRGVLWLLVRALEMGVVMTGVLAVLRRSRITHHAAVILLLVWLAVQFGSPLVMLAVRTLNSPPNPKMFLPGTARVLDFLMMLNISLMNAPLWIAAVYLLSRKQVSDGFERTCAVAAAFV